MIKKLLLTPFEKFVKIESFSGILLFVATLIAILWANSPFADSYESLWNYQIGLEANGFSLQKPLLLWINDGLMAVFFFLIGLEIKRELLLGELNSLRKAAFPFFAALGGMLVPLSVFLLLNTNPETENGWGIPMATDIAFTLAILKLLGKRAPLSLKIFLTAFAIVDDLGAVLVVALFYSAKIDLAMLGYAAIPLAILIVLAYRRIYSKAVLVLLSVLVWFFFLKSGVHPTIAGVLLAFTVPIRNKINAKEYTQKLVVIAENIENAEDPNVSMLSKKQIEEIDNLEDWTDQVQSPLQHLEHKLHNWVAYFIMPIFALANAGVAFAGAAVIEVPLVITIVIALYVGNCVGVTVMALLGVKLKATELPPGMTVWQIIGVAFLAGVGFTMSIFIANLAFATSPVFIDSAKIGILIGSLLSGITGYLILRFKSPAEPS
ncbi:Na+/H+ antiporter NhaA [Altibacter sp.]|uniref:Na+/H+ antiporter NhaA n=1 Tax=Altibacter sp. TaxID=2024823 RepID=UPI0025880590|nr:Na+/H+ antiporter NhaA [Altibacter sp.]MCW8981573.1 Na+/H+ antiporter NhaA [Altibacter sp.]MCW9038491.1 Na+/H+ antiporter NhaA [Altibacter sp.]